MRWRRRALTALMLASRPAEAKTEKLLLDLYVNGSSNGTAFVVVEDNHVLIDEDSAQGAGIAAARLPRRSIGKHALVDISAIGAGATVAVDAAHGKLDVTLPGNAFGGATIDVNASRERRDAGADPSLFINTALSDTTNRGGASVFLDAGAAFGHWLLRDDPSWSQAGGFLRGLSRLDDDDTAHDRRWTFGDQFAYSNDPLGGTALIGGIGVTRAFDLDPYLITFPQPAISGVLQAPGTVNVYENGVLVSQRQVPAGPFNLASLGLGSGQNDVRVVVQDPFGGTSILQQNFYGATAMLAPGFTDYGYQIGFARASLQAEGYELGRPVALARQSVGLTGFLTAGMRVEAETGVVNGGPSINLRLPIGLLTSGISGSQTRRGPGLAYSAAYQYSNRVFNVGAGLQQFSGQYRRIGDDELPASFRPRRIAYVNAGLSPLHAVNLSFTGADTVYADGSRQRNIGASLQYNLPRNITATLSFTESFNRPGRDNSQISLNLTIPVGRTSFGVTATRDSDRGEITDISAQRSVPSDNGIGFDGNAEFGRGGVSGIGQVSYQSQYGFLQLNGQHLAGETSGSALLSGSIVGIDGHLFLSRAVRDGFALVQVPDTPNVTVTRENQPVGQTDANGNLLVTDLLPYQANRLGIDQGTVPLNRAFEATDKVIGVPRLGGTIIRFGMHTLHAARGRLEAHGKTLHYGSATLRTEAGPRKTLIGLDGSFYFDDLPPGRYTLDAHSADGDMTCTVVMPSGAKLITNLGHVACGDH